MAVLRLDQFTIDPADTGELLTRHGALVAAAKDAFPGLIEAQLVKVDDQTWLDVWRWDSLASARRPSPARRPFPRPRPRSRSPKLSPWNSPRSSMCDRTRPVPGRGKAGPCGRRDHRRLAWPAPTLPRVRRGGERA